MAGAVALGTALVHTTVKAILPAKVVMPLISGAWFLGGAFIIFRVTASTAAGWAAMTQRNARRKLMLHTKLEAIEVKLESLRTFLLAYYLIQAKFMILCSYFHPFLYIPHVFAIISLLLLQHRIAAMNALSTGTLGPPPQPAPLPPTETQSAETHAAGIKRPSPTGSTGSSIEMVEAPLEEEERGGKNASGSAQNRTSGAEGAAPSRRGKGSFESWKAYASLGGKKTE